MLRNPQHLELHFRVNLGFIATWAMFSISLAVKAKVVSRSASPFVQTQA